MKVLKFGGSSVGSAQGLRQVRRIVAANDGQIVVVVSALGGITDRLLATAAAAAAGKPDYTDSLAEIMARHRTTIDETVASERRGAIRRRTDELLDELANILRGVYLIRDLSPRTGDAIVSYGERLSSGIVAAVLEGSRLYDAREFIRTKTDFGKHIAEPDLTEKLIRERLADRPRVSVSAGLHRLGLRHGRRDQSGARRIGLHRRTHRRRAERRDARNLDRRRRFHDGRPARHQRCLCHRPAELRRGDGAVQLRREGGLSAHDLPGLPPRHPHPDQEHLQPRSAGHVHLPRAGAGARQGDQGNLLDQQHLSGDHSRAGHGRRDRRQPPHLPHTGQGRHQRLLRVAGRLGEHHVDRTAQRGRRSGHRDAHQGVRPRNRDRRSGQHHRRTRPGDDRRGGRRHETYARHRGQAVRDAGTQRHQRHRLHAGRLGDQHLGGRDARKPSEGDQRDPRLVLPVGVSGTQHLRGRRRTGGARPAGTDPPATAHAHGRQRTPNPRRGNRQLPQTAHRRRRHRPERLPPAARRGGNALDAGEPARRNPRPEHLQLGLRRLHGQRGGGGALPFAARPQRLGGGLQQDRRVVRLRPLPRAQNRLAQTQREIPLRDQRRRRSADHQHDLRPDKQRRPHPAHRGGGFGDAQRTSSTA